MTVMALVCVVIVSMTVVALALMAVRLMLRAQRMIGTATRSLREMPALMQEVRRAPAATEELLLVLTQIAESIRSYASQGETATTRTSAVTTQVFDEFEHPITRAIGVLAGTRPGASVSFGRWQVRFEEGATVAGEVRPADAAGRRDIIAPALDQNERLCPCTDFHDYGG